MFDSPPPGRTLRTLLGALVFILGLQSIRFFFGSLTWYVRDTIGVGVTDLIPIALAPFIVGALIPITARWLTVRGGMWIGMWLLVTSRVVNQMAGAPIVDLWSSGLGALAFVGLLPLMLSAGRSALVGGMLLGIAVDSAIRGMGLSLDLAYQTGLGALAATLALCVSAIYVLWASPPIDRKGAGWRGGALLLGIAPVLFFEQLIFQNQGWTSEVAGIAAQQAQLRIALLNVVALIAVTWFEKSRTAAVLALGVVVAAVIIAEGGATAFNVLSLAGLPALGLVWAAMVPEPEEERLAASVVYGVGGMVLFVIFGLAYYVPLDLDLGFTQADARMVIAGFLAVIGLAGASTTGARRPGVSNQAWALAALTAALPLLGFVFNRSPELDAPRSEPLRVMTYNIHSAHNTDGVLDIEAIATVIEDSGAVVVGLQEVPRGRLISGLTDQLSLLQNRLGFEYAAFFGTTDPTWGNAILSRFPIEEHEAVYLPQAGTPLRRGYLGAKLAVGDRNVLVISTHLQHVNDSAAHDEDPEADLYPVHHAQIATVLETWDGAEPAVLVGDFNARPDWRQTGEVIDAGWVDSWAEAGVGDGFTSNAADPRYRIDYIFHTPDMTVSDVGVVTSLASDHFPVVADLVLSPG